MSIEPIAGYSAVKSIFPGNTTTANTGSKAANAAATAGQVSATSVSSVNLSATAKAMSTSDAIYPMDTNKGSRYIDLNSYFDTPTEPVDLMSTSLLMPNAANVAALQEHISSVFPGFLAQNGIPEAPETMRFNSEGELVLPNDYPYKDELNAAFKQSPEMLKEISTANALASHAAALQEQQPFHEEYANVKSNAEALAIIEKYSYFFDDNRSYPSITLSFSKSGELSILADDKTLV